MPQAPAAISRRFIAGLTGTAPIAFHLRRNSARLLPGSFRSAGGRTASVCLTRIVLVARFEAVDRMVEGVFEGQMRVPNLLAKIADIPDLPVQSCLWSEVTGAEFPVQPVAQKAIPSTTRVQAPPFRFLHSWADLGLSFCSKPGWFVTRLRAATRSSIRRVSVASVSSCKVIRTDWAAAPRWVIPDKTGLGERCRGRCRSGTECDLRRARAW